MSAKQNCTTGTLSMQCMPLCICTLIIHNKICVLENVCVQCICVCRGVGSACICRGVGWVGSACICRGIAVCTYLCMADSKIFPRLPRRQSFQKSSSLFKSGVGQNVSICLACIICCLKYLPFYLFIIGGGWGELCVCDVGIGNANVGFGGSVGVMSARHARVGVGGLCDVMLL